MVIVILSRLMQRRANRLIVRLAKPYTANRHVLLLCDIRSVFYDSRVIASSVPNVPRTGLYSNQSRPNIFRSQRVLARNFRVILALPPNVPLTHYRNHNVRQDRGSTK